MGEQQRGHRGMPDGRITDPLGEFRELTPCGPGGQAEIDTVEHEVHHHRLQFVAVGDVAIQRHGAHAQRPGDRAHRQARQTVSIDNRECGCGDLTLAE